ncbi:MAG TPA: PEGA domain-containing protein [Vicinamibacterales bacterium]
MKFRVVAIPLFAAICLASPTISSAEQVRKGRGYSPREGGGSETATRSGGDSNRRNGDGDRTTTTTSRPAERRADSRPEERRAESRPEERRADSRPDNDDDRGRYAVPRGRSAVVNTPGYNAPRGTVRPSDYRDRAYYNVGRNDWPRININIGPSYGGRYYAPVHYDYWARQYVRWSPVRYAPWGLIYGSIGFPNYGYYGGVGPSPFYYGYNGYGWSYGPGVYSPYPTYAYPHEAGGVRLKIRPRDAQVFVDGHYAGLVDDFDGVFQALRLEAGGHRIEIRMPGFEDLALDVHVQPGRTLTLEEFLRPRP